jgi:hypothetical protein
VTVSVDQHGGKDGKGRTAGRSRPPYTVCGFRLGAGDAAFAGPR